MSRVAKKHKHLILDEAKIQRAKKLLGARSETEVIERALDELIEDRQREARLQKAHLRFLRSGAQIKDVYGRLDGQR